MFSYTVNTTYLPKRRHQTSLTENSGQWLQFMFSRIKENKTCINVGWELGDLQGFKKGIKLAVSMNKQGHTDKTQPSGRAPIAKGNSLSLSNTVSSKKQLWVHGHEGLTVFQTHSDQWRPAHTETHLTTMTATPTQTLWH